MPGGTKPTGKVAARLAAKLAARRAAQPQVVNIDSELAQYGAVPEMFEMSFQWHSVLVQLSHEKLRPTCDEPAFRVLRFCKDAKEAAAAAKLLSRLLDGRGDIYEMRRNCRTLICRTPDRQSDPAYQQAKSTVMLDTFRTYRRSVDKDFADGRYERRRDMDSAARERQAEFTRAYNEKGWIKYMRRINRIDPSIDIMPNNHVEAEKQTEALHQKRMEAEARAAEAGAEAGAGANTDELDEPDEPDEPDELDEPDEPDELDEPEQADAELSEQPDVVEEDEATEQSIADMSDEMLMDSLQQPDEYPPRAKAQGQTVMAVSFIIEDGPDMEVILWIHGYFDSAESARELVHGELTDALDPLEIYVVDMYTWVYPVRMMWNNTTTSKRVVGLSETWGGAHGADVAQTQGERAKAIAENKRLRNEVTRKKKLQEDSKTEILRQLNINEKQLLSILGFPDFGAGEVVRLFRIQQDDDRAEAVRRTLRHVAIHS